MRNTQLKNLRLYALIDKDFFGSRKKIIAQTREIIDAGIDIIQLRDKSSPDEFFLDMAFEIKKIAAAGKIPLIINDRLDIAKIINADGIHLGQNDIPVCYARKFLGDKIIGKSCHCLGQAIQAEKEGVDYISIGPIFQTLLKPGIRHLKTAVIRQIKKNVKLPFFAVGGMNLKTIPLAKEAGAERFAFCRLLLEVKDKRKIINKIKEIINNENID